MRVKSKNKGTVAKLKKNGCLFKMIWIVFIGFVSVLTAKYAMIGINDMLGIGRGNEDITIEIPADIGFDGVVGVLSESGAIKSAGFFKMYVFATKTSKNFAPGTYELRTNMDYEKILSRIRDKAEGKDTVSVTFREGMNVLEVADLLAENGVCGKEVFLDVCNSGKFDEKYDFVKNIINKKDRYYNLEGYLFPDTYEFYKSEDASTTVSRFLSNFQTKIVQKAEVSGYTNLMSIKELASEAGKSVDDLISMASLIQAESANKSDMFKVSSVIHNRLKIPPGEKSKFGEFDLNKLRIDSTVWYPYRRKNLVPAGLAAKFTGRYDTYEIQGMPAGAICNPGIDAVMAALRPESTDYYYFCHSSSGSAYYAKTNDAHIVNLKRAGLL
jgi:UPF0755 protein